MQVWISPFTIRRNSWRWLECWWNMAFVLSRFATWTLTLAFKVETFKSQTNVHLKLRTGSFLFFMCKGQDKHCTLMIQLWASCYFQSCRDFFFVDFISDQIGLQFTLHDARPAVSGRHPHLRRLVSILSWKLMQERQNTEQKANYSMCKFPNRKTSKLWNVLWNTGKTG